METRLSFKVLSSQTYTHCMICCLLACLSRQWRPTLSTVHIPLPTFSTAMNHIFSSLYSVLLSSVQCTLVLVVLLNKIRLLEARRLSLLCTWYQDTMKSNAAHCKVAWPARSLHRGWDSKPRRCHSMASFSASVLRCYYHHTFMVNISIKII